MAPSDSVPFRNRAGLVFSGGADLLAEPARVADGHRRERQHQHRDQQDAGGLREADQPAHGQNACPRLTCTRQKRDSGSPSMTRPSRWLI